MRYEGVNGGDGVAVNGDYAVVTADVEEGLGVMVVGTVTSSSSCWTWDYVAAVAAHKTELGGGGGGGGGGGRRWVGFHECGGSREV